MSLLRGEGCQHCMHPWTCPSHNMGAANITNEWLPTFMYGRTKLILRNPSVIENSEGSSIGPFCMYIQTEMLSWTQNILRHAIYFVPTH